MGQTTHRVAPQARPIQLHWSQSPAVRNEPGELSVNVVQVVPEPCSTQVVGQSRGLHSLSQHWTWEGI